MRVISIAGALCLLGLSFATVAQPAPGRITGSVHDQAGAALPGATVRLAAQGTTPKTTLTNAAGAFTFSGVAVADYDITATLTGFAPFTTHVWVGAGKTTRVALVLGPRTVNEIQSGAAKDAPGPPPPAQTVAAAGDAKAAAGRGFVTGNTATLAGDIVGGLAAPSAPPRVAPSTMPPSPTGPPLPAGSRPRDVRAPGTRFDTAAYDRIEDNPFRAVAQDPLSTFSIDVDTASYANVRRFLSAGTLPPPDAVRIEELINYFRFDYPRPARDLPFSVTTELAGCPWNPRHRLALVGLQSRALEMDSVPARNLVFLLDVSGSMSPANRLPLIRTALRMLVDTLTPQDRIAIVVYAGATGVVLPSTSGAHKDRIHEAIARLEAGGSTNGAAGISLAYQIAQEQFVRGGINRVILATDGDFNVGVTSQGELTRIIEQKRTSGIFLSVLGVGDDNLKDSTMEKLADKGNGNYSYLDSLHEARKVLVREAGATLVTVAKDVKIQVEFNPAAVSAYRLIGYENRVLRNEEFNDDRKDAGEIGAGHTVTALYEIVPAGTDIDVPGVDPLKYQRPAAPPSQASRDDLMTVKLRYKARDGNESRLMSVTVKNRTADLSPNAGFAAAVAEFGMLLRSSEHRGSATHADAIALARRFRGEDADGYRAEFIRLVELAGALARAGERSSR